MLTAQKLNCGYFMYLESEVHPEGITYGKNSARI
jgi:hypothetical protein